MIVETDRYFGGRINTDDAATGSPQDIIPNGDVRIAKYLRSIDSSDSINGVRSTFLGNEKIPFEIGFLPAGTNIMLGCYEWAERNSIVFIYYNSNGNHFVAMLDTITEVFVKVLDIPVANLDLDYPIYDIKIINNLLSFSDGKDSSQFWLNSTRLFNPPWRINIDRALANQYNPVDLQAIEALKYPPENGPLVAFGSEPDVPNRLRGKVFEFRYNYIYWDGESSALSPISDMPLPTKDEWVQGVDYSDPFVDNKIKITYNTGHYTCRKIRLYVSVNKGQFALFHEINKDLELLPDEVEKTYDFYNNLSLEPIPLDIPNEQGFPQTARLQESLQTGNGQIAYFDYYEGYDNVDVDYSLSHRCIEIPDFNMDYSNFYIDGAIGFSVTIDDDTVFTFSAGETYVMGITITAPAIGSLLLTYTITQEDINTALGFGTIQDQILSILGAVCAAWAQQINDLNGSDFVEVVAGTGTQLRIDAIDSGTQPFFINPISYSIPNPLKPKRRTGIKRCVKRGWTYYLALIYQDRGNRDGTVQKKSTAVQINIPFPSEEAARAAFTNPNSPYYVLITMTIDNVPPIWATHYKIVVRKVSTSFEQRSLYQIISDTDFQNTYKISLENYYERTYQANISHSIQVGDRVRFVTQDPFTGLTEPAVYMPNFIELEVLKYDPSGGADGSEAIWVSSFDANTIFRDVPNTGQLMDIYTPTKNEDQSVWFEIFDGMIGDAYTDTRYHKGQTQTGTGLVTDLQIGSNQCYLLGDHSDLNGQNITIYLNGDIYEGPIISAVYPDGPDLEYTGIYVTLGGSGVFPDSGLLTWESLKDGDQNQIVVDGVSTQSAIIQLDWGDIYYRQVDMGTGFSGASPTHGYYYVESPSRSDYSQSSYYALGRPNIENNENRRIHRKTAGKHSKEYIDNTLINGLSDFTGLDNVVVLNEQWGNITRVKIDGKVLHIIQNRFSFPVYLQGTFNQTGDGETAPVAFSNRIFGGTGNGVPLGCVHAGSVVNIEGNIYFYDYFRGTFFVMTGGGSYDICESKTFKFKKWITDKTKYVRENFSDIDIFSVVDIANSEYITVFRNKNTLEQEGCVFNYKEKKWDYVVDYPLRWGGNLGTYLLTTNGTDVYKHNSGQELVFYDNPYLPELVFVMNDNSAIVKRPMDIGVKSNQAWNFSEITVPAGATYPTGMRSQIPAARFVEKENNFWSPYLRDETNIVPSVPWLNSAAKALVSGRELRGLEITHKMTLNEVTERVRLYSVHVDYEPSRPIK